MRAIADCEKVSRLATQDGMPPIPIESSHFKEGELKLIANELESEVDFQPLSIMLARRLVSQMENGADFRFYGGNFGERDTFPNDVAQTTSSNIAFNGSDDNGAVGHSITYLSTEKGLEAEDFCLQHGVSPNGITEGGLANFFIMQENYLHLFTAFLQAENSRQGGGNPDYGKTKGDSIMF